MEIISKVIEVILTAGLIGSAITFMACVILMFATIISIMIAQRREKLSYQELGKLSGIEKYKNRTERIRRIAFRAWWAALAFGLSLIISVVVFGLTSAAFE
ncbi:hypothetical protein [Pelagicoccus mobilis]|uniref:Uncharacterized protein n=1 Tax=Pelagicoccus mobilis TaxID=415221 RepID=A0A934S6N1_9BACT|nr:hypothetical protein [Pelagicoccus mobilis]MBK1880707.1 hypothetical protein [Pelagicoccus mobilis]